MNSAEGNLGAVSVTAFSLVEEWPCSWIKYLVWYRVVIYKPFLRGDPGVLFCHFPLRLEEEPILLNYPVVFVEPPCNV